MKQSTYVSGLEDEAHEHGPALAALRLRRGASAFGLCTFHDDDRGATLEVGAALDCDWQIASAGVAGHALHVLFTGEALHARSADVAARVRCNGAWLEGEWTQLDDGDRLELGCASIEVCVSSKLDHASVPYAPEAAAEDSPASLLGAAAPRRRPWSSYALAGLLTACAYAGWVVLLDWL